MSTNLKNSAEVKSAKYIINQSHINNFLVIFRLTVDFKQVEVCNF